jgi:hypothetical protein
MMTYGRGAPEWGGYYIPKVTLPHNTRRQASSSLVLPNHLRNINERKTQIVGDVG